MKNYIKHIALLSLLIIVMICACKKTDTPKSLTHTQTNQDSIAHVDSILRLDSIAQADSLTSIGVRDSLVGSYYGVSHYIFSGPPNSNTDQDVVTTGVTIVITRDSLSAGLVLNHNETFAQLATQTHQQISYLNNYSYDPDQLQLFLGIDSIYCRYNDYSGVSHRQYNYFVGKKIR